MIKTRLYSSEAKKITEIKLDERIFNQPINDKLMAQAVYVRLQNARLGTRKTKTRGEVRGGGRKPWRQKGTGRARHGSIRSPIWVGGGDAHALRPKSGRLRMSKKMRRAALFSSLSLKYKEGHLLVIDKLGIKTAKTQAMAEILKKLPWEKKLLLVLPEKKEVLERSSRNLAQVNIREARLLNAYDVLTHDYLLFVEPSLKVLGEVFQ